MLMSDPAENRRCDLSASSEIVGKRLAEAKKITIVLNEDSLASLLNAVDILKNILQFAQLKNLTIEFQYYNMSDMTRVQFFHLLNPLKECFGLQFSDRLAPFNKSLPRQLKDVYILPPGILSDDERRLNEFITPTKGDSSIRYLIDVATVLGMEEKLLAIGLLPAGVERKILEQYAPAKLLRMRPHTAHDGNVTFILSLVEPKTTGISKEEEEDEVQYATLSQFDSHEDQVLPAENVVKAYETICASTLAAIKAYNPQRKSVIAPVMAPASILPLLPIAPVSPPHHVIDIPPVSPPNLSRQETCCALSARQVLWGLGMLSSGLATMLCVTYFLGDDIEAFIKTNIANNPGWVELDVLAAEGISGVLGGVALPAGKKMLDGISCCTRACCGLFFRRRAERSGEEIPLLTTQPPSSSPYGH